MGDARVFLVYWGASSTDTSNEVALLQAYYNNIGSTRWFNHVNQYNGYIYSTTTPTAAKSDISMLAGTWYDTTNTYPASPTVTNMADEARRAYDHFNALGTLGPSNYVNSLVVILRPKSGGFPSGACAYHSNVAADASHPALAFADLGYQFDSPGSCYTGANGTDSATLVAGHETIEAITDPYITLSPAYFDNVGQENADKCQNVLTPATVQIAGSSSTYYRFKDPPSWSNEVSGCVNSRATESTSFQVSSSALYQRQNASSSWTSWGVPTGKTLIGRPTSVSWGPIRLDAFVRNLSGTISHAYSNSPPTITAWDDWGAAPATYTYTLDAGVASWGLKRLDLFMPANKSSVTRLLHRSYDDGTDSGWVDIGVPSVGTLNSGPAAVSWAPGRVDAFMTNGANALAHVWSNDGVTFSWDTFTPPAGYNIVGKPTVASWGVSRLDVFMLDSNGTLDQFYYDNGTSGWGNWGKPSTGNITQYPAVVAEGDKRLRIEVIGQSSVVYQRTWVNGTDSGWVSTGTEPGSAQTSLSSRL